jgi:hypothetical protein
VASFDGFSTVSSVFHGGGEGGLRPIVAAEPRCCSVQPLSPAPATAAKCRAITLVCFPLPPESLISFGTAIQSAPYRDEMLPRTHRSTLKGCANLPAERLNEIESPSHNPLARISGNVP